jgi:hypothetical protein
MNQQISKLDLPNSDNEVVEKARVAFNNSVKVFPMMSKEEFLCAFLAGYLAAMEKAQRDTEQLSNLVKSK